MYAKPNTEPVKGARCLSCTGELDVFRMGHPGDISTSEHEIGFIGYCCQNPNCKLFALITRGHRLPLDAPTPLVETKPEAKK